jgi:hypothetical protein
MQRPSKFDNRCLKPKTSNTNYLKFKQGLCKAKARGIICSSNGLTQEELIKQAQCMPLNRITCVGPT